MEILGEVKLIKQAKDEGRNVITQRRFWIRVLVFLSEYGYLATLISVRPIYTYKGD